MRVAFLLADLEPSGGANVVTGHAGRLAARDGFETEIVLTSAPRAQPRSLPGVPVVRLDEASDRHYDIALATWWETAAALWELDADRRVLFLQSIESRFYPERELMERMGADAALGMPVELITIAGWMRDLMGRLRPGTPCPVVPNGIDKELFGGLERTPREGPLRVLVEGQPSLWFKGVPEALAAVRAMSEPALTTVVALDPGAAGELGAERVVGGLDAAGMARLYAEHDVLLRLSRIEGLPLPPLEAFHAGVPCVVTPFTGHEEYVRHGHNGLVVGFDDLPATSRALDLLARDTELLGRLSAGALATAAEWPDAERSTDLLAEALSAPPPPNPPSAALLAQTLVLHRELGRERMRELDYTQGCVEDLAAAHQRIEDQRAEILRLRSAWPYRAAAAMRRLRSGGRP